MRPCRSPVLFLLLAPALVAFGAGPSSRPVVDAGPFLDPKLPDCGFQKAIDLAAEKPGGAVVKLPEGTFALRRGLVLRSEVELVGAGMDKTVLTPARKPFAVTLASAAWDEGTKRLSLGMDKVPEGIEAGLGTMLTPTMPPGHIVYTRPGVIASVDRAANTVVVETPYGQRTTKAGGGVAGLMTGGLEFFPEREIKKGDAEIVLRNAKGILPGDELAIGEPPNESMLNMVFVKEVRGNTLVLEAPARADFALWPPKEKFGNAYNSVLLWAVCPMIHGANIKGAAIRDLTVRGPANPDAVPLMDRYTVAGIHLYGTKEVTLERVAVRDWHTDGVSLQVAEDDVVRDCVATGNKGNGFHPGTGAKALLFEGNLSTNNAQGLYFCWSNEGQTLRNNRFVGNRGPGLGGLGNPHDQRNTIEKNLIADNGGPGIEINGGLKSGNVIRDNVIENNSRSAPGRFPGILVHAASEDAMDYTITGNVIRDTQKEHTQLVGVEERATKTEKKATRADENVIRGNQFSGHERADIVVVGEKTVVEGNGNAKVVKGPLEAEPSPKK